MIISGLVSFEADVLFDGDDGQIEFVGLTHVIRHLFCRLLLLAEIITPPRTCAG